MRGLIVLISTMIAAPAIGADCAIQVQVEMRNDAGDLIHGQTPMILECISPKRQPIHEQHLDIITAKGEPIRINTMAPSGWWTCRATLLNWITLEPIQNWRARSPVTHVTCF